MTPWRGLFRPMAIISTNSVEDDLVMPHTEYLGSMPCGFRQEVFYVISMITLSQTSDPWGGVIIGLMGIKFE